MRFNRYIKRRRLQLGLSQRAIDAEVQLGTGWLSRVESGEIHGPPSRAACEVLARVLQLDADDLWSRAAPERLRAYDEDLLTWHVEQLEHAWGSEPHELLTDLANLDQALPGTSVGDAVEHLLTTLASFAGDEDEDGKRVRRFAAALGRLTDLPIETELELLDAVASQIEVTARALEAGARQGRGAKAES